jgi:hypothetical protein
MSAGTAAMVAFFSISLFISSFFITTIVYDKENYQINGITVNTNLLINHQDFTSNTTYDQSLISNFSEGFTNSNWVFVNGIGLIAQDNKGKITWNNVQKTNGVYDITYYLNNTVHADFYVYVVSSVISSYDIVLKFNNKGVGIINNFDPTGLLYDYFYSYPDVNKINSSTVRTLYNPDKKSLSVYLNGNKLFDATVHDTFGNVFATNYAGLVGDTGFSISNLDAPLYTHPVDFWGMINDYTGIFFELVTWSLPPEYSNVFVNFLISMLILGLFVSLIALARGV